jgi:ribonuclease HI
LESNKTLHIYTDSRGINNKIGVMAVALQESIARKVFIEEDDAVTVYAAKLEDIKMALEIAIDTAHNKIIIFTDNQATLKAIANPGRPSGQYILREITKHLDQL